METSRFNLISLVVIVVLLGLLSSALFPSMSGAMLSANMTAVGTRGKDIYVAITAADTEREALGFPSVWPQSNPPTNNAGDISRINFTNSTDYFYALYDGARVGTAEHHPYVKGFDYSKLAGAGVPTHSGGGRLKPDNNMWTIAKNLREDMEEIIPVLVTRNLAAESLVTDLQTVTTRPLCFDEEWMDPFRKKGVVIIRKGGGMYSLRGRYTRVNLLYGNQTFTTTIPGSQPLRYLTPSKEVTPTEATYQACATANANPWKRCRYWLSDQLELASTLLPALLIMGLVPGVHLFLRASSDKNLSVLLSVAGFPYWLLLWLAATLYMCCPLVLLFNEFEFLPFVVVVVAPVFQMAGCFYLLVWERMTGNHNHEAFGPAFLLMLSAPLIALRCLLIATLFSLLFLVLP
jgi:type II secretory pathway pseudopilin PulG